MKRYYLNTTMTSFSRDDELVAWFPHAAVALQVNTAGLETLEALAGEGLVATGENLSFLDGLTDLKLLDTHKPEVPVIERQVPETPSFDSLTLFLTEECNLACRYCYADGGTRRGTMDSSLARRAIAWMGDHCATRGKAELHLAFHGAGEPTLPVALLKEAATFAREVAHRQSLEPVFSIGTNGIMTDEARAFIIDHEFDISLSLDGLEEQHNSLRPLAAGSSFHEAFKTAAACTAADLPFSVRTTVAAENLPALPEFVTALFEESGCEIIQLEPVYLRGRGAAFAAAAPDPDLFVETVLACMDIAEDFDAAVTYSGISWPGTRDTFCQACGSSLCVTPGGIITGCYESAGLHQEDPFRFGTFTDEGSPAIDHDALEAIAAMDTMDQACHLCPARHHCAGDCPAKMTGKGAEKNYRCTINKRLLEGLILRSLDVAGSGWIDFN